MFAFIGLLLCVSLVAPAQTGVAILRGAVTDQNSAIVPGVEISVTEPATGVKIRTVVTDNNGNYEIPDIKPGTYQVKADKSGFKPFVADGLLIEDRQTRRLDIVLQVGAASETVTVNAGAEVLTTDTGTISSGFDNSKFRDTPLIDIYPSPFAMFSTLPGVQGNGWNLRISGQGREQYSQGMDGIDNDRTGEQVNNMNFYQEASIVMVNAPADSARVASYNLVSKRGANQWHGMVYYKHFSSALNARTFFEPRKTPFIQHEWQGEISGPIWKDKTHFYFSLNGQKIPLGSFNRALVPTQKMRDGDFSDFTAPILDPLTGRPFPGNRIPRERINPVSAKVQELYIPTPNLTSVGGQNYGWVHPFHSDYYKSNWPFVRVDHQLTANNSLYGRYIQRKSPYVLVQNLPQLTWTRLRDHRQYAFGDTHVFSPALVNTFQLGFNTNLISDGLETAGVKPISGAEAVSNIGLQGVNPKGYKAAGFPAISITGVTALSTTIGGVKNDDVDWQFEDSLTWSKGRHVWKFGGQFNRFNSFFGEIPNYGSFSFNGAYTGLGYADFLLGIPRTSSRVDPLVNRKITNREIGLYVQDSFKVSNRLTLDLGVRWDFYDSPRYEDGLMYNFDPASGNVIVPQPALSKISPLYPTNIKVVAGDPTPTPDKNNIRPRLAAAYRLGDNWVIRGGYGQFTERIDYFQRVTGTGPFEIGETYDNAITGGVPLFTFPNPFPSSLATARFVSQSARILPTQTDLGTIHQFNFSIEREYKNAGFRASYIGSRGRGLNYALNINKPRPSTTAFTADRRPFSQFIGVTDFRSDGSSNYDSLQLQAQRKMGDFTFNAHYTWANNLFNYGNLENPYDVTSQWGHDSPTRRHYAVINTTYNVPLGKGGKYLSAAPAGLDHLVSGWTVQTISYFGSGTYFTPGFSGQDVSNTNSVGGVPDRIKNGSLPSGQRKPEQWFDISAFKIPGCPDSTPVCTAAQRQNIGRFGNAGFNFLEGKGLHVYHLSFSKKNHITERLSFTFVTAISDLFNRAHFNNPAANISVPATVGRFQSVIADFASEKPGHRVIMFKGRIEF